MFLSVSAGRLNAGRTDPCDGEMRGLASLRSRQRMAPDNVPRMQALHARSPHSADHGQNLTDVWHGVHQAACACVGDRTLQFQFLPVARCTRQRSKHLLGSDVKSPERAERGGAWFGLPGELPARAEGMLPRSKRFGLSASPEPIPLNRSKRGFENQPMGNAMIHKSALLACLIAGVSLAPFAAAQSPRIYSPKDRLGRARHYGDLDQ